MVPQSMGLVDVLRMSRERRLEPLSRVLAGLRATLRHSVIPPFDRLVKQMMSGRLTVCFPFGRLDLSAYCGSHCDILLQPSAVQISGLLDKAVRNSEKIFWSPPRQRVSFLALSDQGVGWLLDRPIGLIGSETFQYALRCRLRSGAI